MKHKAVLYVGFEDKKSLESAILTLKNENGEVGRAKANLTRKDKTIIINIVSEDATSLRAALNSYLRCIQVIENMRCING